MSNFIEKVSKNSKYSKIYHFIEDNFTENEVIDEMTVWSRYYRETKDQMNGEFSAHYGRVIRSLLQEGKIRIFSGDKSSETFIIQKLTEKNEPDVKEK